MISGLFGQGASQLGCNTQQHNNRQHISIQATNNASQVKRTHRDRHACMRTDTAQGQYSAAHLRLPTSLVWGLGLGFRVWGRGFRRAHLHLPCLVPSLMIFPVLSIHFPDVALPDHFWALNSTLSLGVPDTSALGPKTYRY